MPSTLSYLEGQVSFLRTVHPLLALSFFSTRFLPLFKRKILSSKMDGLPKRERVYVCAWGQLIYLSVPDVRLESLDGKVEAVGHFVGQNGHSHRCHCYRARSCGRRLHPYRLFVSTACELAQQGEVSVTAIFGVGGLRGYVIVFCLCLLSVCFAGCFWDVWWSLFLMLCNILCHMIFNMMSYHVICCHIISYSII